MSHTPITPEALQAAGAFLYDADIYANYVFGEHDKVHCPLLFWGHYTNRHVVSVVFTMPHRIPAGYIAKSHLIPGVYVMNQYHQFTFPGVQTMEQLNTLKEMYLKECAPPSPDGTPITPETLQAAGIKREPRYGEQYYFCHVMYDDESNKGEMKSKSIFLNINLPDCPIPDGLKEGAMVYQEHCGIIYFPLVTTIEKLLELFYFYTGKEFTKG